MKKNIELRIFKVWLLQYTDLQYYVGLWSWKVKYFNFIQFDTYIWMITNEVLQIDVKNNRQGDLVFVETRIFHLKSI